MANWIPLFCSDGEIQGALDTITYEFVRIDISSPEFDTLEKVCKIFGFKVKEEILPIIPINMATEICGTCGKSITKNVFFESEKYFCSKECRDKNRVQNALER